MPAKGGKTAKHTATNSERQCWHSCKFKWALRYGLGIRPEKMADPLEFGSIFHKGLEVWWAHGSSTARVRVNAALDAIKCELDQRRDAEQSPFDLGSMFSDQASKFDEWEDLMGHMMWGYEWQWASEIPNLTMLCNEQTVEAATQTPSGKRSPWARYSGVIDKAIKDQHGQVWILDHKTTGSPLHVWRRRNQYSPQALTYGWLYREAFGVQPVGIVYDLCFKAKPASVNDYTKVKDGSRLVKTMPKNADPAGFRNAIAALGQTLDSEPWYREQLSKLERRSEGQFFMRVRVRWDHMALDRVGAELYATATDLRRAHDATRDMRSGLLQSGDFWRAVAPDSIRDAAYLFTRQDSCFNKYGRACSYLELCRVASEKHEITYLLDEYRLADQIHEETTVKQENEQ